MRHIRDTQKCRALRHEWPVILECVKNKGGLGRCLRLKYEMQ